MRGHIIGVAVLRDEVRAVRRDPRFRFRTCLLLGRRLRRIVLAQDATWRRIQGRLAPHRGRAAAAQAPDHVARHGREADRDDYENNRDDRFRDRRPAERCSGFHLSLLTVIDFGRSHVSAVEDGGDVLQKRNQSKYLEAIPISRLRFDSRHGRLAVARGYMLVLPQESNPKPSHLAASRGHACDKAKLATARPMC